MARWRWCGRMDNGHLIVRPFFHGILDALKIGLFAGRNGLSGIGRSLRDFPTPPFRVPVGEGEVPRLIVTIRRFVEPDPREERNLNRISKLRIQHGIRVFVNKNKNLSRSADATELFPRWNNVRWWTNDHALGDAIDRLAHVVAAIAKLTGHLAGGVNHRGPVRRAMVNGHR